MVQAFYFKFLFRYKMVEASDEKLQEAVEMPKYFWMITQNEYECLRQIEGCGDCMDHDYMENRCAYI